MTIHSSGSVWKAFVRSAAVEVDAKFPRPDWTSTYPGHGEIYPATGEKSNVGQYAVDFMISSRAQGDKIADYLWKNSERLGIRYVIWYKRIISHTRDGKWHTYVNPVASRRGTASGDHTNHVHASFFSNGKYVPLKPSTTPVVVTPPVVPVTQPEAPSSPSYATPSDKIVYVSKLVKGQKDSDSVYWVQKALGVALTGTYDDVTVSAAKAFQKSLGDDVDGQLGILETKALFDQHKSLGVTVLDKP